MTTSKALGRAGSGMMLAFVLGLLVGLVGCPRQALVVDSDWVRQNAPDEELRTALEQALASHAAGDFKAALSYLEKVRLRTSDPDILAFVALREGMAHLRLGEDGQAHEVLQAASETGPASIADRTRILDGLALFRLGRTLEAALLIASLDLGLARATVDDPVLVTALLVASGDIALGRSDWSAASLRYSWATQGMGATPEALSEAQALLDKLDAALAGAGATADLLQGIPAAGPFWALLARRAAKDAILSWDLDAADDLLEALSGQGFASLAGPLTAALESARSELSGTDPMTVGAILPLSGKNSEIGLLMKEGIETAQHILAAEHPFKIVFLDDADSPDIAREHVRALKKVHGAIAAIGPAAGATAAAAADEAEKTGLPLIALTLKPGITTGRSFVVRNFSTHDAEADLLARYAVCTAGLTRIGILHPDSTYGRSMATRFAATVSSEGGAVALTLSYPPAETNFVEIAAKVAASKDLQALFVPAASQQLGLIAPALAYHDVWSAHLEQILVPPDPSSKAQKILFIAPQVAYSSDLPAKAGKYLQGAVFSAGFFAESLDPFASFFVEEYARDHTGKVTAYHAYAADALFIVASAVALGGIRTRSQLAVWLHDPALCTTDLETVGSFGGFDATGEALAPLQLFRLQDKTFVSI